MTNENNSARFAALTSTDSKALAAQVVAYRIFKLQKDFAIACMEELAKRRQLGDPFDYETFIEEEIKKIPEIPNLDLKSINNLLNIKQLASLVKL